MPNKMLIDATHPEETRVVVVRGNRVEEFDFESAQRKQLRGNIYLAKVTRVEPSLQAAFVEYGGNRHGFLAFSEIHPDYYQIPVADRLALIEDEERAHREAEEEHERRPQRRRSRHRSSRRRGGDRVRSEVVDGTQQVAEETVGTRDIHGNAFYRYQPPHEALDAGVIEAAQPSQVAAHDISIDAVSDPATASGQVLPDEHVVREESVATPVDDHGAALTNLAVATEDVVASAEAAVPEAAEPAKVMSAGITVTDDAAAQDSDDDEDDEDEETAEEDQVESVGGDDALEEVPERSFRPRRQYKIQEVIKRRQVMLIQVVKEERGNKGAALTTYLSLAGRYAVLMPNTARGGGISRKITSAQDRSRLKEVVQDLDVPEGMGIILRTAGASRTKPEIKRDFEYLLRMWETVRDLTLRSSAPTLVYEEGSLIKRSIRDLYNKEIDEIMVAGETGHTEARDFMKMLMPSAARAVKLYRDSQPLFSRMGVESQLDAMFSPTVQLRSGGYIVINQTEALVSIDVNSGRSTREHHIEDTALKTNLEAAEEVARQLRLRDLAGLIVIDFIDMDEKRNNRAVERKLSDCLRHDRARIQVGRISHFGLLEMSRQRIRASVLESSTEPCPHCGGTGHVRSVASVALQLIRGAEEILMKGATHNLVIRTRTDVALYVLNHKRAYLRTLEEGFQITISVMADAHVAGNQSFVIDRGDQVHTLEAAKAILAEAAAALPAETVDDEPLEGEIEFDEEQETSGGEEAAGTPDENGEEETQRRGRRRRRRRGGRNGDREDVAADAEAAPSAETGEAEAPGDGDEGQATSDDAPEGSEDSEANGRRRRRGRRGGRRRRNEGEEGSVAAIADETGETVPPEAMEAAADLDDGSAPQAATETPAEPEIAEKLTAPAAVAEAAAEAATDAAPEKTRRRSTIREKVSFAIGGNDAPAPAPAEAAVEATPAAAPVAAVEEPAAEAAPRKAGWWSRRFGSGS